MQHGVQRIWKKNEGILFTEFIIHREGLTDKRKNIQVRLHVDHRKLWKELYKNMHLCFRSFSVQLVVFTVSPYVYIYTSCNIFTSLKENGMIANTDKLKTYEPWNFPNPLPKYIHRNGTWYNILGWFISRKFRLIS